MTAVPHDEQTETDELNRILTRLINPEAYSLRYEKLGEAKADLEAWSRQQTAHVLERLKDDKEQLNIERINGSVLVVPLAAIDAELAAIEAAQARVREGKSDD